MGAFLLLYKLSNCVQGPKFFRVSIKRHDLSKSLPNRCSTEKVIFVKNELEFNLFISADSIEAAKARRKKVLIIFASMLNLPPVNEILN